MPNFNLQFLSHPDIQTLRNTAVSAEAAQRAKVKVDALISAKRSAFETRRQAAKREKIAAFNGVKHRLRTRIAEIKNARPNIDTQRLLQDWGSRYRNRRAMPRDLSPQTVAQLWQSVPTQFIVKTRQASDASQVKEQARRAFGLGPQDTGISVETLYQNFKTDRYFVVRLEISRQETNRQLFQLARALKTQCNFASVQPEQFLERPQEQPNTFSIFSPVDPHDLQEQLPNDTEWPLTTMNVKAAWRESLKQGRPAQGEGIVIAHPDSGWNHHRELDEAQIDSQRSHNVLTGQTGPNAALHDFGGNLTEWNRTHGTCTSSIMVSAEARPGTTVITSLPTALGDPVRGTNVGLTGAAPKATILPIRCINTVVLISDRELARAIEYAIKERVDVISISLGGPFLPHLEEIINQAVERQTMARNDIIVVAAAGQVQFFAQPFALDFVAEPGAYANVICAAATTIKDRPWSASLRGPEVDVSAPGVGIYCADFKPDGENIIVAANGTSFSAAYVASLAALWLAHHGKQALQARYPNRSLAQVFRHLLTKTARPQPYIDRSGLIEIEAPWNTRQFGAGIVDAHRLLQEPLPDESAIPPMPRRNVDEAKRELSSFLQESPQRLQALAHLAAYQLRKTQRETVAHLAEQWRQFEAIAASTTGVAKAAAERCAAQLKEAWEDAEEEANTLYESLAERAEETAREVAELLEEATTSLSGAATELVDACDELFSLP
ncbi:MAG: S8/S53 family peptidase [Acidobacteria bacterium]|nr:S8/S53 family peptidase [Acidobacteriota bacterium]